MMSHVAQECVRWKFGAGKAKSYDDHTSRLIFSFLQITPMEDALSCGKGRQAVIELF